MPSKKTLEHYLRQMRLIEEHREKWCEENIRRHYRNLMTDLQEFLGVQYAQLAVDDKLTFEILHDKATYARFLEEVEQRIDKFSPQAAQEIRNTVQLTYQRAYEGMIDAVEKAGNIQELHAKFDGLRAVRPEIIKNAIKNKYMETALEKNHKETIYDIRKQIAIGLSQGDRMSTMANRLSDQVSKHYNKAMCIARTEVHRVREAGYQDSSERLSEVLKNNDSDYVMTKTWKTMKDMSVRPYRRKGKKGHKSFVKGKGPNHVKMEGVTVLVDEEFDLGDGVKAKAPGQSGVAGHDINCRCYLSRDLMTKAEFEALTGKSVTGVKAAKNERINNASNAINDKFADTGLNEEAMTNLETTLDKLTGKERQTWYNAINNTTFDVIDDDITAYFDPNDKIVHISKSKSAHTILHETAHAIDEGAVSYIVDKGRSWEYEIKSASGLVQHFHFKQVGDDLEIFYKKLGLDKDIASDADLFTAFLKWGNEIEDKYPNSDFGSVSDILSGLTDDKTGGSIVFGGHEKAYWTRGVTGDEAFMIYHEAWADYCTLRATQDNDMLDLLDEIVPHFSKSLKKVYEEAFGI